SIALQGRRIFEGVIASARPTEDKAETRVPDAVQRSSRCSAEPGSTLTFTSIQRRWAPDQQRRKSAAPHPGHAISTSKCSAFLFDHPALAHSSFTIPH